MRIASRPGAVIRMTAEMTMVITMTTWEMDLGLHVAVETQDRRRAEAPLTNWDLEATSQEASHKEVTSRATTKM
eukprot:910881-Karenia_brevis.AAC.1